VLQYSFLRSRGGRSGYRSGLDMNPDLTSRTRLPRVTRILVIAALFALLPGQYRGQTTAGIENSRIQELMAGANGNSKVQFLVLEHSGLDLFGPQGTETQSRGMLVFFDGRGHETGKFKFPTSPAANAQRVLIATQEFASLLGAPAPDILIPPLLNGLSGKVCWRSNPSNTAAIFKNECVSYGVFDGDTEVNRNGENSAVPAGQPAPELPIMNAVSLKRSASTGRNADFAIALSPSPANSAGAAFTVVAASKVLQGETLFNNETFAGNGRTCATCHVEGDSFGLSPKTIQSRFATLAPPTFSFDPLFIGESAPSGFDAGFDFNLNTLVLSAEVATPSPCTGELRGVITTPNGARAKVLARASPTTYLIYGGWSPRLSGTVSDSVCSASVANVIQGDLASQGRGTGSGLEDPRYMRQMPDTRFPVGRGLILENIDGFDKPPVSRKSPHLLNLRLTAPYGLSGEFPDLRAFTTGAVRQHFPRTQVRSDSGPSPDFRLPTPEELEAIEAFLLTLESPAGNDPNKFDLARFATTELQRIGREEFDVFGCTVCHGGSVLSETTTEILGQPKGVNGNFNTGTNDGPFGESLPCEPSAAVGACGSREYSTPQLFNLPSLGPFFHNGSASTLEDAVSFYLTSEFGTSPANLDFINRGIGVVPTGAITEFLAGLVERPYSVAEGPMRFSSAVVDAGQTRSQALTIRNTGNSTLEFEDTACRVTGKDPEDFSIVSCPLSASLPPGQSRTITVAFAPREEGLKSSILEIHPSGVAPWGVDLFGIGGTLGTAPQLLDVEPSAGNTAGGTAITLTGANFLPGATVAVGEVPAGFVEVLGPATILARTGAHAPGMVAIEVVNPDGQRTVLSGGYQFQQ